MVEANGRSELAVLVESPAAAAVLTALSDGPQTRTALADRVAPDDGALDDALDRVAERGWIRREADTYRTTRVGSLVAAQFEALSEAASLGRTLGDLADLVPVDDLSVDLRQFADADVVRATDSDAAAPEAAVADLLHEADEVTVVGDALPATVLDALAAAVDGGARADVVLGDAGIDALTGVAESEGVTDSLASDAVTAVRHEGPVGSTVGLADETAWVLLGDDPRSPDASLSVDDDVVRAAVVARHALLMRESAEAVPARA
jgi:predicted transcriptional regulator